MEIYTEAFLSQLPEHPVLAASLMLDELLDVLSQRSGFHSQEETVEAHAFLREYLKSTGQVVALKACPANVGEFVDPNSFLGLALQLRNQAANIQGAAASSKAVDKVAAFIARQQSISLTYKFTDEDYGTLQEKLNALRDAVQGESGLTPEHRARILHKIEGVQRELHKEMPTMDRLLGLTLQGMVIVKKLGKEAVQIAAIVKVISAIVAETVRRAEGIETEFFLASPTVFELPDEKNVDDSP